MGLRALPLPDAVSGRVWLGPMPGRLEPWPEFLDLARAAGLTQVLCLTPRDELARLSPAYDTAIRTGALPFAWQPLPMDDYGLAADAARFVAGIETAALALERGEVLLLHCAAGIGRTGTAAACLLKRLGLPTEQALRRVQQAGSNPQSALQSGLIERF
ncbi:protein-tyrosine phosphatase family protein [Rivibacter subsaxonicus]|uniref:Tyrosine phosphatase family protein n=1 Tax=Rivibacter subsaxonicus TaxID=457575 RepID=A0A4Q7W245_9BURK|nr:tyrosine-protein phosphatase [Rivibacter subsaxonicus]RZU02965.1 tyrosine phosphatase family protein [Rivibacter subsaxonicus]